MYIIIIYNLLYIINFLFSTKMLVSPSHYHFLMLSFFKSFKKNLKDKKINPIIIDIIMNNLRVD